MKRGNHMRHNSLTLDNILDRSVWIGNEKLQVGRINIQLFTYNGRNMIILIAGA